MESNVGFRIFSRPQRPADGVQNPLSDADISHIADAMNKFGVIDWRIQPVYRPIRRVVGHAFTVKVHPGDHLMIRKAMDLIEPGDVLVIDSRADETKAVWGGMVSEMMVRRHLGAVVIDGAVRDVEHIKSLDLPVWARAVTSTGPTFTGPGEINVPVSCGGVAVLPGDLLVCDEEGLVVVPKDDVSTVVQKIGTVAAKERGWMDQIQDGKLVAIDSVDQSLSDAGVTVHEEWKRGEGPTNA